MGAPDDSYADDDSYAEETEADDDADGGYTEDDDCVEDDDYADEIPSSSVLIPSPILDMTALPTICEETPKLQYEQEGKKDYQDRDSDTELFKLFERRIALDEFLSETYETAELMMERLSGEKMLSQDDVVVYHRTLSLLMECARKAQLLSDTVNQDTDLPQKPPEIAAKSAL